MRKYKVYNGKSQRKGSTLRISRNNKCFYLGKVIPLSTWLITEIDLFFPSLFSHKSRIANAFLRDFFETICKAV